MTEKTVLASGTPFRPKLPQTLHYCLLLVFTRDIISPPSWTGVQNVLTMMVTVCISIIRDTPRVLDQFENVVFVAITSGSRIQTFKWMPEEWTASLEVRQAVHQIKQVVVSCDCFWFDILMRLQQFLEIAHRSTDVIRVLNASLMTLYSLDGNHSFNRLIPVNYSFLFTELSRFADVSQTNDEVMETLLELCHDLEMSTERKILQIETSRKSIIDLPIKKIKEYQTRSTSAKVNHTSIPPRTKMIDNYQVDALHRLRCRKEKGPKRHRCPVCRLEGHHARTCNNILLEENADRADKFLRQMIETAKIDSYISSLAKRQSHRFVEVVLERIKRLSARHNASNSPS